MFWPFVISSHKVSYTNKIEGPKQSNQYTHIGKIASKCSILEHIQDLCLAMTWDLLITLYQEQKNSLNVTIVKLELKQLKTISNKE